MCAPASSRCLNVASGPPARTIRPVAEAVRLSSIARGRALIRPVAEAVRLSSVARGEIRTNSATPELRTFQGAVDRARLPPHRFARLRAGFTVVEILVVVAIVALLLGLLLPGLASARHAADRTRTRMRFAQWTTAIEAFRAEYGSYPDFDASGWVNGGAIPTAGGEHPFHDVLAGRRRDGTPLGAGAAVRQNFRRVEFHSFGAAEFTGPADPAPHLLRDASGGTSIAVLVDRNRDGRIDPADYAAWPEVLTAGGETIRPGELDLPAIGVRAGVLFYSADPLASRGAPRFVRSW